MARVDEWFSGWLRGHMSRHPRGDWPQSAEDRSVFFAGWKRNFIERGIDQEVAEAASIRMQGEPSIFPEHHCAKIVEHARRIWKERTQTEQADGDPRETARLQSANCPDCGDGHGGCTGFATRYRRRSLGRTNRHGGPEPDYVIFYCRCPFGRWMKQANRTARNGVDRRMPDLEDYPALWHDFQTPPGSWELPQFKRDKPAAEPKQPGPKPLQGVLASVMPKAKPVAVPSVNDDLPEF